MIRLPSVDSHQRGAERVVMFVNSMRQYLGSILSEFESEPSGPRFRWRWVVIPLVATLLLTVFVRATGFDLYAQKAIFRAGERSWAFGEDPFWQFFYQLGTVPTTLVVVLSLVGFFLSWSRDGFRRWRRVFVYFLLVAVVGPGIITNAILKEYWGRPRPREVEGLGGHNAFEEILTLDLSSAGKSFPCGHATMGFYFLCGFFLLRGYRKVWADTVLLIALILGGVMGLARMLQGAHFFSDVIWAGAVCWFTCLGLYYVLGLDKGLVRKGMPRNPMPLKVKLIAAALGLLTVAGIVLASPYRDVRNFYIVNDFAKEGPISIQLRFVAGDIEIVPGDEFRIEGEAYGHGMPTSNIAESYWETDHGDFSTLSYVERISGLLTEAGQSLTVSVPWGRIHRFRLEVENARVWLRNPDPEPDARIQIIGGNGTVTFLPEDGSWKIREKGKVRAEGKDKLISTGDQSRVLSIAEEFEGRFLVEQPETLDEKLQ